MGCRYKTSLCEGHQTEDGIIKGTSCHTLKRLNLTHMTSPLRLSGIMYGPDYAGSKHREINGFCQL
jgi:hypothetical protein